MDDKRYISKLGYYMLPIGFEAYLRKKIKNILLPYKLRTCLSDNKKYFNRHAGERCFILATGPSINEQDLTKLEDDVCIALGLFYLHKDIKIINPLYHIEAPNHEPFTFSEISQYIANYRKYYTTKTKYFFGYDFYKYSFYNYIVNNKDFNSVDSSFINYAGSMQLNIYNYNCHNQWDISKNPFSCRTVVYSAIQVAVYMGFKEIYLLGCDHDYLSRYFVKGFKNHHFYEDEKGTGAVEEYLDSLTLERWFQEYYYRWKQYRLMREFTESKGCKVYNATNGGLLDVFPRVNLDDII
jgi:hypothetical protein